MLKTGSLICFVIRGKHPVCGEPLFCFSANPDSLSELCGFHINHRSRSFLLKVSGVSSHLSFCCTSLVSGFIIQEDAQFVYSQSAQQIGHAFASKVQISGIHEFRPSSALLHLPGQRLCPADRAGPSQTLLRHIKQVSSQSIQLYKSDMPAIQSVNNNVDFTSSKGQKMVQMAKNQQRDCANRIVSHPYFLQSAQLFSSKAETEYNKK